MSIGVNPIGSLPIAADTNAATTASKPPKRRQITARADLVQPPEPR